MSDHPAVPTTWLCHTLVIPGVPGRTLTHVKAVIHQTNNQYVVHSAVVTPAGDGWDYYMGSYYYTLDLAEREWRNRAYPLADKCATALNALLIKHSLADVLGEDVDDRILVDNAREALNNWLGN